MKAKEVIRSCQGCGRKRPKAELLRVALFKDGAALLDLEQNMGGRGIYLCPQSECIARAARRRPPKAAQKRCSGPALAGALEAAAAEVDQIPKGVL